MPSESSSVVSNATNGIEPPRDFISVKKSKKGPLKQIVPEYSKLKNNYTLLWDMKGNEGYIIIVSVLKKYFDQALEVSVLILLFVSCNNNLNFSLLYEDFLIDEIFSPPFIIGHVIVALTDS